MNAPRVLRIGLIAAVLVVQGQAVSGEESPLPSLAAEPEAIALLAAEPGCGPARAPDLKESFVPIEGRRGVALYPPIKSAPTTTARIAAQAGYSALEPTETFGRSIRYRGMVGPDLVGYYGVEPVSDSDTLVDFLSAGGIIVVERPNAGVDLASRAAAALGEHGTSVAVGRTQAVMNHGDELAAGLRPYYLFWTDHGSDWTVVAGMKDPANAIDVARSIACQ